MGPGYSIEAVTHLRYGAPPFILVISSFFFRVGLCSCGFLTFSGDVASRGASDAIATTDMPRSRGPASTGSPSKGVLFPVVDRVSEFRQPILNQIKAHHGETRGCIMKVQSNIGRLGFKEIVDPTTWHRVYDLRATWTNQNATIKIRRAIYAESWDCSPRSSSNRGRRSVFIESNSARFLLTFSFKYRCSSLCTLTFDRIVKQLSDF